MSIQSQCDELIEWYAQYKPRVMQIPVNARPATLRRFCKKERRGPYRYKGYIIVPIKPKKQEKPIQESIA